MLRDPLQNPKKKDNLKNQSLSFPLQSANPLLEKRYGGTGFYGKVTANTDRKRDRLWLKVYR